MEEGTRPAPEWMGTVLGSDLQSLQNPFSNEFLLGCPHSKRTKVQQPRGAGARASLASWTYRRGLAGCDEKERNQDRTQGGSSLATACAKPMLV